MKDFTDFISEIKPEWNLYEYAVVKYGRVDSGIITESRTSTREEQIQVAITLALLEKYHKWLEKEELSS